MACRNYVFMLFAVLPTGALAEAQPPKSYCCGTNDEGKAFLEQNKDREGVITLKSGVQYKVLSKGEGKWLPKVGTLCEMGIIATTPRLTPDAPDLHSDDWLTPFENTYRPLTNDPKMAVLATGTRKFRAGSEKYPSEENIKGFNEVILLMVEGDEFEVYVPSELAYGDKGHRPWHRTRSVEGGEVIIARLKMNSIRGGYLDKLPVIRCDVKSGENCNDKELALVETWGKRPLSELKAHIKSKKKQHDEPIKTHERLAIIKELLCLQQIKKLRAGGDEL